MPFRTLLVYSAVLATLLIACRPLEPRLPGFLLSIDATPGGSVLIDGQPLALPYHQELAQQQRLLLSAVAEEGYSFAGWGGGIPAAAPATLNLRLGLDTNLQALFIPDSVDVTVVLVLVGDGRGRVFSDPTRIDCRESCFRTFEIGNPISFYALPDPNAYVVGWAGCDAVVGDRCDLTPTTDRSVYVQFSPLDANPAHDAFMERAPLSGSVGVVRSSNAEASAEAGEPEHAGTPAQRSLWWRFTSPVTGRVTFDARASSLPVRLAGYHGDALSALTPILAGEASPAATLTVDVVENEEMGIAVDSDYPGGFIRLAWQAVSAIAWSGEGPEAWRAQRGEAAGGSRTLTLSNQGSRASSYTLTSEAPWLTFEPASGILAAGASSSVALTEDACDTAGVQRAAVQVAGGGASTRIELERVCIGAQWRASAAPLRLAEDGSGNLNVLNDGNEPATLETDAGPTLVVDPQRLLLAPGETVQLAVRSLVACGQASALQLYGGGHRLELPVHYPCDAASARIHVAEFSLNQAVPYQTDGVPLVVGRRTLVRLVVTANRDGVSVSDATVHLLLPGEAERRILLRGPSTLPTAANDSASDHAFEVVLEADVLRPGAALFATLLVHAGEASWSVRAPAAGHSLPRVETASPLPLLLVPIVLARGDVPILGDIRGLLSLTHAAFPLDASTTDIKIAEPFTTSSNMRQQRDWSQLARRLVDVYLQAGADRQVLGLLSPPPTSFVAGIGILGREGPGGFLPVALSTTSPNVAPWVIAHELGHNWGRSHAPCATPDPDPNYPYDHGSIGVWGFDPRSGSRRDPADAKDLMSYCSRNVWISDYTYAGVLAYRRDYATLSAIRPARHASVLVVSGSVDHESDALTLDPIVRLPNALSRASEGPYRLRVWDTAGVLLAEADFDTFELSSHIEEIFHVTLPLPSELEVGRVRIERDGVVLMERVAGITPASAHQPPRVEALSDGWLLVRWAAAAGAELIVRDSASGQLLGSDQGGELRLPAPAAGSLEALISDGLTTRRYLLGW